MAAIDRIYLNRKDYLSLKDWCKKQPPLHDKYGKETLISDWLRTIDDNLWKDDKDTLLVMSAPYHIDAYIIRNCPIKGVQEELMLNYGHWSQERIRKFYEDVKNWNPSNGECPYWAKLDDFIFNEDGTITLKGIEKSDYERILDGELYTLPYRTDVEYGSHFRLAKSPNGKRTIPYKRTRNGSSWRITVENTENRYDFMHYNEDSGTWDFTDEFVISKWASSYTFPKTITALKRKIRKWRLPVGFKVIAAGRYVDELYEFVVTK